jgi:O-antigen/teichoic acid export membrane protein
MLQRFHQFRRWAGVDRAVFFSNAGQLLRLVTGPITMVLVLQYLTPEIQGYFYAFSGIVAMQVFLEMGFSQNILQFASHEFAKLHFTPVGKLEGDPVALSRMISLGRLAFGYYAVAAGIFFVVIGVGGHIFFAHSGQHGVAWEGAWWLIALSAACSLAINPAGSLLGGCNQVAVTAKFGFWSALASFAMNALALIMGAGIYVSAISAAFSVLLSVAYFGLRWWPFFSHFLERPRHGKVSWAKEIWPFQWRIAVTWMSSYFIFDIINPIAFYFCGAVEAGRLGMSLQLARMIYNVAMTWIYTKSPRFGMLIATRAWSELDRLWRRSALQSFVFCLLGMMTFWVSVPLVGHYFPKVPARLAPMGVNLWLGGAMLVLAVLTAMSMELRAHKREPYMWLSVANAVLSVVFILPLVWLWGIYGEAMGYALAIWAVLIPGYKIYRDKRLEFRRTADHFHAAPSPAEEPGSASGGIS